MSRQGRPGPRRLRRLAFRIAAVGLGTLGLLGLLELGARLAGLRPPAGLKPARVNAGPRAPGSYRVIALGGSTVYGAPLPELGFVRQLEARLRHLRPDRPLEVINLGIPAAPAAEVLRWTRAALDAEPDLLVVLSVHNEFLRRPTPAAWTPLERLRARSALDPLVRGLRARLRMAPEGAGDALPSRQVPYERSDPAFARTLRSYEATVGRIVAEARERGVPLLLLTGPSNLAGWPPVYRRLDGAKGYPGYEAEMDRLLGRVSAGDCARAGASLEGLAARLGAVDAMIEYLRGLCAEQAGELDRARAHLLAARERDPYPWRALACQNEAIRALGSEPGVELVDAERLFEERSPGGLVGLGLVADNCHPTPRGGALMAWALAQAMARRGWFLEARGEVGEAEAWMEAQERDFLGPAGRARRLEWLLACATYVQKAPFLNFDLARRYLAQASELDPGDWRVLANQGVIEVLEGGDPAAAARRLEEAARARGAPLEGQDRNSVPYLAEALERLR